MYMCSGALFIIQKKFTPINCSVTSSSFLCVFYQLTNHNEKSRVVWAPNNKMFSGVNYLLWSNRGLFTRGDLEKAYIRGVWFRHKHFIKMTERWLYFHHLLIYHNITGNVTLNTNWVVFLLMSVFLCFSCYRRFLPWLFRLLSENRPF